MNAPDSLKLDASAAASTADGNCPVNSHNEWDPLEEVIVGSLEHATIPVNHLTFTGNLPRTAALLYRPLAGMRYPGVIANPAKRELEGLARLLEREGIKVRRPDPVDFNYNAKTPFWKSKGFCTASPRDGILIVGDEMIETPMAWRSRYFEVYAYRTLLNEYFDAGARWTSAPKPMLDDKAYDYSYTPPNPGEPMRYMLTEAEPLFDAADFTRCGRDLFYTRSNVTNKRGVEWLRRHLGDGYRLHEIETRCTQPMHIDTTFVPLGPGKVLINPEFVDVTRLPKVLKDWQILVAPQPDPIQSSWRFYLSLVSKWISLNMLKLDEKRVICEASQVSMIAALKGWGFEPIPLPFMNYKMFGGGFHCATLDIRRRGQLQSYF